MMTSAPDCPGYRASLVVWDGEKLRVECLNGEKRGAEGGVFEGGAEGGVGKGREEGRVFAWGKGRC